MVAQYSGRKLFFLSLTFFSNDFLGDSPSNVLANTLTRFLISSMIFIYYFIFFFTKKNTIFFPFQVAASQTARLQVALIVVWPRIRSRRSTGRLQSWKSWTIPTLSDYSKCWMIPKTTIFTWVRKKKKMKKGIEKWFQFGSHSLWSIFRLESFREGKEELTFFFFRGV